jgi:hypothetical protein
VEDADNNVKQAEINLKVNRDMVERLNNTLILLEETLKTRIESWKTIRYGMFNFFANEFDR